MEYTEVATVVFLVHGDTICLAQKKQNIHTKDGKELSKSSVWNGYGGKREPEDASIRDTAIRELFEESGVKALPDSLVPAGRFRFFWPGNNGPHASMEVYFFFLSTWEGTPEESAAMGKPAFFHIDSIPYEKMLPDNILFLPRLLQGERLVGDMYADRKDEQGLPLFIISDEELLV